MNQASTKPTVRVIRFDDSLILMQSNRDVRVYDDEEYLTSDAE